MEHESERFHQRFLFKVKNYELLIVNRDSQTQYTQSEIENCYPESKTKSLIFDPTSIESANLLPRGLLILASKETTNIRMSWDLVDSNMQKFSISVDLKRMLDSIPEHVRLYRVNEVGQTQTLIEYYKDNSEMIVARMVINNHPNGLTQPNEYDYGGDIQISPNKDDDTFILYDRHKILNDNVKVGEEVKFLIGPDYTLSMLLEVNEGILTVKSILKIKDNEVKTRFDFNLKVPEQIRTLMSDPEAWKTMRPNGWIKVKHIGNSKS